jgi:predicted TIM-barrel fold metal-dependent hydrolase
MTAPVFYDNHAHTIIDKTYPLILLFERYKIPKFIVDKALKFAKSHEDLLDYVEKAYEALSPKELNLNDFLSTFRLPWDGYIDLMTKRMDEAGIGVANLLMLDLDTPVDMERMSFTLEDKMDLYDKLPVDRFNKFMAFDPRRRGMMKLARKAIEDYNFDGFKLYPPLGYKVSDLEPLFDYCSEEDLPMIFHCSAGGIGKDKKYCYPKEFLDTLFKYPGLRLCLAHAGGNAQFVDYLLDHSQHNRFGTLITLCQEFENVYFDVAFHNWAIERKKDYREALDICMDDIFLADRLLWGSDYPLHLVSYHYKEFVDVFKETPYWETIASQNSENFLFGR